MPDEIDCDIEKIDKEMIREVAKFLERADDVTLDYFPILWEVEILNRQEKRKNANHR